MAHDSERFLKRGDEHSVAAGKAVFDVGDPCSDGDVYFLISGRVVLEVPGTRDPQLARHEIGPGAVFGMAEPYGGARHRGRRALALEDCKLYRWSRKSFDDAMGIYQELATQTIRTLSGELRAFNQALARFQKGET